jgi:hypothetical protein
MRAPAFTVALSQLARAPFLCEVCSLARLPPRSFLGTFPVEHHQSLVCAIPALPMLGVFCGVCFAWFSPPHSSSSPPGVSALGLGICRISFTHLHVLLEMSDPPARPCICPFPRCLHRPTTASVCQFVLNNTSTSPVLPCRSRAPHLLPYVKMNSVGAHLRSHSTCSTPCIVGGKLILTLPCADDALSPARDTTCPLPLSPPSCFLRRHSASFAESMRLSLLSAMCVAASAVICSPARALAGGRPVPLPPALAVVVTCLACARCV